MTDYEKSLSFCNLFYIIYKSRSHVGSEEKNMTDKTITSSFNTNGRRGGLMVSGFKGSCSSSLKVSHEWLREQ